MLRRCWVEDDGDPTAVIADVVAGCARACGAPVDDATRSALAVRLEIGFAERIARIVAQIDRGWQRIQFEAAMRRSPRQQSVLDAAFRALDAADLTGTEKAAIARMLDLELDAAVPMLVQTMRRRRYDPCRDALVPRWTSGHPQPSR